MGLFDLFDNRPLISWAVLATLSKNRKTVKIILMPIREFVGWSVLKKVANIY